MANADLSLPERPPRPPMSNVAPAPVARTPKPTGAVRVSRALWRGSLLIGGTAIFFAALFIESHLEQVAVLLDEIRPGIEATTRDVLTRGLLIGALAALAIVTLVEALLVRVMITGKAGARWGLAGVLLAHSPITVVSVSLMAPSGEGVLAAAMMWTQLVLAGVALIASVLPGAGVWFRGQNQQGLTRD